jgi:hypothetical protein
MNALLSPTLRQSTGNNAGDLKRPAEVTPVPTSTTITSKRSRHVTVTPKRIGESATEPVSANDNSKSRVKRKVKDPTNLYRDVYNLLEESTAKHPELIRWTDDGKGFFCDGSDKVKLTKWLGNFGMYGVVWYGRVFQVLAVLVAVPSRRVDSHIPLSLADSFTHTGRTTQVGIIPSSSQYLWLSQRRTRQVSFLVLLKVLGEI